MNKYICLDCKTNFEIAATKPVFNHQDETEIIIDVCPNCFTNHIEPVKSMAEVFDKSNLVLLGYISDEQNRLLVRWNECFISKCMDNKLATNDPTLLTHYTNLISDSQELIKQLTA